MRSDLAAEVAFEQQGAAAAVGNDMRAAMFKSSTPLFDTGSIMIMSMLKSVVFKSDAWCNTLCAPPCAPSLRALSMRPLDA